MSVSLSRTDPIDDVAEPAGPTYRLSTDQYSRMKSEAIFGPTDQVRLIEGILCIVGASSGPSFYRLSVEQYRKIADADILTNDDRVELLEGWLFAKMSKKPPHTIAKGLTQDALIALVPTGWFVAIEDAVTAIDSQPEPDIAIVRGSRRDYRAGAAGSQEVALVAEVSYSSLPIDRSIKKRMYARSGFPIYWLINLIDGRIEVYTDPSGPTESPDYLHREDFGPDDGIPVVIAGREVGRLLVRDLLS